MGELLRLGNLREIGKICLILLLIFNHQVASSVANQIAAFVIGHCVSCLCNWTVHVIYVCCNRTTALELVPIFMNIDRSKTNGTVTILIVV